MAQYTEAWASPNRVIGTKVILHSSSNIELTESNIISYKIVYSSVSGEHFVPGFFSSDTLELSLNAQSPEVADINFKTLVISYIEIQAGVEVSGTMRYQSIGRFYVEQNGISESRDGIVSIKANSTPPVLSGIFRSENLSYPCTIVQMLNYISSHTGVTIHVYSTDFLNVNVSLNETFSITASYREVIAYVAEALGGYACMIDGELYIQKLFGSAATLGCTLNDGYLFSVVQQESSVKPFQYISIKASKDDLGVTQEISGVSTGCEYGIINNPLTYGHPEDFLSGLASSTVFNEFLPAKISFHGRPDIKVGNTISYVYKNTTYVMPICIHTFEYNGGFKTTIESVGSDSLSISSVDSETKSQIRALKQQYNEFSRDLGNTTSKIADIEGDISKISTIEQTAESLKSTIEDIQKNGSSKSVSVEQTAEALKVQIENLEQALKDSRDSSDENQKQLLTYFEFLSDGLVVGKNTSPVKLKLENDKIVFLKDGSEAAYFTEGELFVTDATILRSIVLGNFEIVPRTNGNLSLRRRSNV